MGKRIIQQRRGRGTLRYRVRKKAYKIRLDYPKIEGQGKIVKLISTSAHSAPVAMIKTGNKIFFNIAAEGIIEGQTIQIGKKAEIKEGNIVPLEQIPIGTSIYNIEIIPFTRGKLVRSSGLTARIVKKTKQGVIVKLPSKKEKIFNKNARATIGMIAASGRTEKPIVKAGKMFYMMKAKGRLYSRTSPIKMNAVDHPFGSGRGKNIGKSTIPPRFAPPGRKVGLIRASRSGRKKK